MKKIEKKLPASYNKLYPILLFVATLFMGLGYASLNPTNLTIDLSALAKPQHGVFISNSILNSSDEGSFKVLSTNETLLESNVVLSTISDKSYVSYKIEIHNNTDHDYYYNGVLCDINDKSFYSNSDILFEVSGINKDDILHSKGTAIITLLFKYADGVVPSESNNKLTSFINFEFLPVSNLLNNIVTTISSTTGIFYNSDTSLNYTINVTNNNTIPIIYDVVGVSTDAINYSGGATGVSVAAGGSLSSNFTLMGVNGYEYNGGIYTIPVTINRTSPIAVDVVTYQMEIDTVKEIEFSIDGVTYKGLDNMTWESWFSSSYNTIGYSLPIIKTSNGQDVSSTDMLIEGGSYDLYVAISVDNGEGLYTSIIGRPNDTLENVVSDGLELSFVNPFGNIKLYNLVIYGENIVTNDGFLVPIPSSVSIVNVKDKFKDYSSYYIGDCSIDGYKMCLYGDPI